MLSAFNVFQDPVSHAITDLISFYSLPSSISGHAEHKTLFAAYSFYNVFTKSEPQFLMTDALAIAKQVRLTLYFMLNVSHLT